MKIDIKRTSNILDKTHDEVMFLVQEQRLTSFINEENMSWEFDLDEVIELKHKLQAEEEIVEED